MAPLNSSNGPLIAVVGETASGKSAMALDLAQRFNGEIICADAWTVYRGFDIGTAKPSVSDQQLVPHHLLDVADPAEGFNVAAFKKQADAAIADILDRGKVPFLVGGSGLYIDAVLYDYQFLPAGDPARRTALQQMSLAELQAEAEEQGLDTTGVDAQNPRRLVRLLETNGRRPTKSELRPNTLILGLQPDREVLEKRIAQRVDQMISDGFVDEVKELSQHYGWDIPALNAPGYRAFKPYVEGEATLEEATSVFIRNDLQLAKKQRTWFKRNSSIHWQTDPSKFVEIVTTFLNKKP